MSAAKDWIVSPAEYLALEREATERHELVSGRIYAMSGAAPVHNQICMNLGSLLWPQLRSSPCRPYGSDQRIGTPPRGFYTYPDLSIVCAPETFDPEDRYTLTNPRVLFEVLSPSTEAYDRGAKFAQYSRIESLREYWLICSDRMRVERFVRSGEEWTLQAFEGPGVIADFTVLPGVKLPLDELYLRVALPEHPER